MHAFLAKNVCIKLTVAHELDICIFADKSEPVYTWLQAKEDITALIFVSLQTKVNQCIHGHRLRRISLLSSNCLKKSPKMMLFMSCDQVPLTAHTYWYNNPPAGMLLILASKSFCISTSQKYVAGSVGLFLYICFNVQM
jgi:hypothetical protein